MLPGKDLADGLDQLVVGAVLEQVAHGPGLEHPGHEALVGVHGQGDDPAAQLLADDMARGVHAVQVVHGDVHDDDVGAQLLGQADGFAAVLGLGDHLQALFLLQQGAQAVAHDLVVVGDDDLHAHGFSFRGPAPRPGRQRHRQDDLRALPGLGLDFQPAAEVIQALAHAEKAEAAASAPWGRISARRRSPRRRR